MKKIKAKYAFGGEVRTDGPNPEGVDPYALATGVLASAAPKDVDGTNGFKYATMGASLAAINPVVGAVGAAVGLGADLIAGGRAKKDAASEQSLLNKANFQKLHGESGLLNPYAQPGGFKQTFGMKHGGSVAAGHVIPAERARQAVDDAARAGVNITGPVAQGEQEGGVIPGAGHPRADDKVFQPAGADPIKVSSGEVYVNDDIFQRMAKALGMGVAEYQRRMYPRAENSTGMADGGQIPPTNRPLTDNDRKLLERRLALMRDDFSPGAMQFKEQANAALAAQPATATTAQAKPLLPGLGGPGYVPPVRTNTVAPVASTTPSLTRPATAQKSSVSQPSTSSSLSNKEVGDLLLKGAGVGDEPLLLPSSGSSPEQVSSLSLEATDSVGPRADNADPDADPVSPLGADLRAVPGSRASTGLSDILANSAAKAVASGPSAASPYSYNPAATTQAIANANPGLQSSPGSGAGSKAGTDLNTLNTANERPNW